jgi:tartrate dehydratase alpha subunit/fumarate hydratase class I-like protein
MWLWRRAIDKAPEANPKPLKHGGSEETEEMRRIRLHQARWTLTQRKQQSTADERGLTQILENRRMAKLIKLKICKY